MHISHNFKSKKCYVYNIYTYIFIYDSTCTNAYGSSSTFVKQAYNEFTGISKMDTTDTKFLTCKTALELWSHPLMLEGDVI